MGSTVLITGANRGIGLEFARQYLVDGWTVIGTSRDLSEADQLREHGQDLPGQLQVERLNITSEDQLETVFENVSASPDGLDLLINNAGTYGSSEDFENLSPSDILGDFEINCLGSFKVTRTFLPLLKQERGNVVFLTSLMGSIDDNRSGGSYPYRISKAALNMLGRSFAVDYESEGIYALLLHPGWVQTRMGGSDARIPVEESVSGMRKVIERLDAEMSGEFYGYDGERRPW